MEARYAPSFSLEETATQIALLDGYIGVGETPLVESEVVNDLMIAMQRRVAGAATGVMTSWRGLDEEKKLIDTCGIYHELLGDITLDLALRTYDQEEGNTDKVKQAIIRYVSEKKAEMVAEDYRMRLENFFTERSKQWMAQHSRERFTLQYVAPAIVTALGTAALLNADETSSRYMDLLPSGSVLGIGAAAIGAFAFASAKRSVPRKAGEFFGRLINTSPRTYMPNGSPIKGEGGVPLTADELPKKYAEYHLKQPINEASNYLLFYDINSKDDLSPMVDGLLAITESSLYESYGVDPEVVKKTWYKRWAHKTFAS